MSAILPESIRSGRRTLFRGGVHFKSLLRGLFQRPLPLLLLIALLSPCCIAHCQEGGYTRHLDRDLLNGNGWKQWDARARVSYMHGMFDGGLAFLLINIDLLPDEKKPWIKFVADPKATYQDTIRAIDAFYGEEANVKIPVIFAYIHNVMQAKGFSPATVDEYVARWRKEFNR